MPNEGRGLGGTGFTLYFAYGSNMLPKQMRERCPDSFYICNAFLQDFQFAIAEDGWATLLPKVGGKAYGVVCAVVPKDEATLDIKEEVAKGTYHREQQTVVTTDGHKIPVLVYIDNSPGLGRPNPGYLENRVLPGARHHNLPPEAIASIFACLPQAEQL